MGLLRAAADAVVIGAGTLRASSPDHVWTAEYIYPPLADAYRELRAALGKPEPPLNVVVTGSGDLDLDRRLFRSGAVPSLIVTTAAGARRARARSRRFRRRLGSRSPPDAAPLSARAVLDAIGRTRQSELRAGRGRTAH